jgi:UDP-N-acetylglucosamine 2-epimerase (non-hydrolysing)/GDP/UDP-N,N'-diacetylbacillosamine 2-epimerase (hydrolysing)
MDHATLEKSLGMPLRSPLFLITYHPATLGDRKPVAALDELLGALEEFPQATIVFTASNADAGGRGIGARIDEWVAAKPSRGTVFASLGTRRYLSLMRIADVVIGNSSSALIEAPALNRAAVNVGDRQRGRLKASSIIDAREDKEAIREAIARALTAEFRASLAATQSLYGAGDAGVRIKEILKSAALETRKPFFDIPHSH